MEEYHSDDENSYYTMTESDSYQSGDEMEEFHRKLCGNTTIFCDEHDIDDTEFCKFLNRHVLDIVKFIVHDVKISPEITNMDLFEPAYQYVYNIYHDIFGEKESKISDEEIETIHIF